MKKLLFAAALMLSLLGCAKSEQNHAAPPPTIKTDSVPAGREVPDGWKEVKDNNISFLVPQDWVKVGEGYSSPDSKAAALHLVDPSNMPFDMFVSEVTAAAESNNGTVLLNKQGTLQGRPMAYLMIHNPKLFMQAVLAQDGNTVHSLICGASLDKVYPYQSVCLDVVKSLRFTN